MYRIEVFDKQTQLPCVYYSFHNKNEALSYLHTIDDEDAILFDEDYNVLGYTKYYTETYR